MSTCIIPEGYRPPLAVYDMQCAIEFIKGNFQDNLKRALNLRRVSAPLFVRADSGLNDDLNGYERPVSFDIPAADACTGVVVHSLAKWKRLALKRYEFFPGNGLYTDMNAIRRDEQLDNIHSVYVDQWDWEKVIYPEDRNADYLKQTVLLAVDAAAHGHGGAQVVALQGQNTQVHGALHQPGNILGHGLDAVWHGGDQVGRLAAVLRGEGGAAHLAAVNIGKGAVGVGLGKLRLCLGPPCLHIGAGSVPLVGGQQEDRPAVGGDGVVLLAALQDLQL